MAVDDDTITVSAYVAPNLERTEALLRRLDAGLVTQRRDLHQLVQTIVSSKHYPELAESQEQAS